MVKRLLFRMILPLLVLSSACGVSASVENVDLFLGLGGFERSADFAWQSAYSGGDYDWSTSCSWVSPSSGSGWRSGYNLCKPDCTIGIGWTLISSAAVSPGRNLIARLVDGQGVSGSKAQYVGLRGCTGTSYVILRQGRRIYPSLTNDPKPGDTLVLHVDSVRMTGLEGVPASKIKPTLQLILTYGSDSRTYKMEIPLSSTSASVEVSAGVRTGITEVEADYRLDVDTDLTGKEVGAYLDGVHLYIKRAATPSQYATWEIPAPRPRSIKTMLKYFDPSKHDLYETAQCFDCILASDAKAQYIDQFKAINPSVKVYTYKTSVVTKNDSETPGTDPWLSIAGMQYNYTVTNHGEWLYPDGKGGYTSLAAYPRSYFAHVENSSYQGRWTDEVIGKAKLYGFDGIYLDDLNDQAQGSVHVDCAQCQQFLHDIMPKFRAAGIHIQRNGIMSLSYKNSRPVDNMGLILNNPFFVTRPEFPVSSGYSNNTPYNVSDSYFQEWAFFRLGSTPGLGYTQNTYDKDFWWGQIQDMDLLKTWNTVNLAPSGVTKQMVMHSYGVDRKDDPASGIDGWMQFALASYLLAQNDYTLFGAMDRSDYSILLKDYSITKLLGSPTDTHRPVGNDTYCRYRRYQATADGGQGGVVVVNANPTVSRTYTLDFDALDESGASVRTGTNITLKPHTGRIFLEQTKGIDITISTPTHEVTPGQTVTITVTCVNNDASAAKNVAVWAKVPDGMTYLQGSAMPTGGTYDSISRTVNWIISSLPAHGRDMRTFGANVN